MTTMPINGQRGANLSNKMQMSYVLELKKSDMKYYLDRTFNT